MLLQRYAGNRKVGDELVLSGPQGISIDAIYYWCDFSFFLFGEPTCWMKWVVVCSVESRLCFGRISVHHHVFLCVFTIYIFKLKCLFKHGIKCLRYLERIYCFALFAALVHRRGTAWSGFSYSISEPWRTLKHIRWGTSTGQRPDIRAAWAWRHIQMMHIFCI